MHDDDVSTCFFYARKEISRGEYRVVFHAGHGKTTAIADCLLQCPIDSCQLVLTHTHAGIASLRSKFRQKNVPSSRYQIETITGFAQRYVLSLIGSSALPEEEDKSYFNVAIEKCCSLDII